MRTVFIITIVFLGIVSCASLGSKTIYSVDNFPLIKPSKILVGKPLLVDCTNSAAETYLLLKDILGKELSPYGISIDSSFSKSINFDYVTSDKPIKFENNNDANYLLLAKIIRLASMGQTRDYKVEYKLVTLDDNKLVFHSKYSTTFGATFVVIPGIKDYPNSDQLMIVAIRSGLYELKKKLSEE